MKRGHVSAPQNTFIDTIIRKFDSQSKRLVPSIDRLVRHSINLDRRFLISNAQLPNKPIIYCNDAFCELTGYSRSDIIQRPCTCEFLYGQETNDKATRQIRHALHGSDEKEVEIILYKNTGPIDRLEHSSMNANERLIF
jgi:PAS domain-containing protein